MIDEPKPKVPQLRSVAWRAALGGALGGFAFLIYMGEKDPYTWAAGPSLYIVVLIGAANGWLVGVSNWLTGRWLRGQVALPFRILLGTVVTAILVAVYVYMKEGVSVQPAKFMVDSILCGFIIGGPAGAMATDKVILNGLR